VGAPDGIVEGMMIAGNFECGCCWDMDDLMMWGRLGIELGHTDRVNIGGPSTFQMKLVTAQVCFQLQLPGEVSSSDSQRTSRFEGRLGNRHLPATEQDKRKAHHILEQSHLGEK
jgi:hypothetical protein